jgi:hypothetical protein
VHLGLMWLQHISECLSSLRSHDRQCSAESAPIPQMNVN